MEVVSHRSKIPYPVTLDFPVSMENAPNHIKWSAGKNWNYAWKCLCLVTIPGQGMVGLHRLAALTTVAEPNFKPAAVHFSTKQSTVMAMGTLHRSTKPAHRL